MDPPYKTHYAYFRADAYAFIRENRDWTTGERNCTVSTIWAGGRNVEAHYATQTQHAGGRWKVVGPGLPNPNPIPTEPFTAADVDHAKTTRTMPMPAAGALLPVVPAGIKYVDSNLHDFWPRLPWSPEPQLPIFDMADMKTDRCTQNDWLNTEPHMPPPNDGSQWHGIKVLGSGSFGVAGLWVEADATNNIRDRIVIKETKPFTPSRWRDPRNWRGRLPHEMRIHQLLEERRAADPDMCRHIVRCRAHRLWMELRTYRLYLDYHAGGDLFGAMKRLATNWWKNDPDDEIAGDEDFFLPEGFVWYVIKALATACLVLQEGTTSDIPVDGWRPITHLDLHLPNVLLHVPIQKEDSAVDSLSDDGPDVDGADGADTHKAKKPPVVPILADFGMSFLCARSDCTISENPDDYVLNGVDTRYPPEMHQDPPYHLPLNDKTDVWGIGNIAWHLLANQQPGRYGPIRCDPKSKNPKYRVFEGLKPLALRCSRNFHHHDNAGVLADQSDAQFTACKYGEEVKDMVRRCLNYVHSNRPTLSGIITEADDFLSWNPDLTEEIMDIDELQLDLPDIFEFAIGKPVDEAKRRGRNSD